MAWRRTGDIPLSEPMMSQDTDVYASLDLKIYSTTKSESD